MGHTFNLVGHGQILYVEEYGDIRICLPSIPTHVAVWGYPKTDGTCDFRRLSEVPFGCHTLEIQRQRSQEPERKKLRDLLGCSNNVPCEHLFLLNDCLGMAPVSREIRIPKTKIDVFTKVSPKTDPEPVIPNNDHKKAALENHNVFHEVIRFVYDDVEKVLIDGKEEELKPETTLCLYSEPLGIAERQGDHKHGLNTALRWRHPLQGEPHYNFAPHLSRGERETTNTDCTLDSLVKLIEKGRTDDSGCLPAFLGEP